METVFHLCEAVAHALVALSHHDNLTKPQQEELIQHAASLRLAIKEERQHRSGNIPSDVVHCPLRSLNAVIVAHDGATTGER